uniref:Protein FAR1-RELATED SEQUENCE n=1 Tax=Aegilops tauschii subsp. strangulata TaxID=200361 RepID=A0A453EG15_AEGTS
MGELVDMDNPESSNYIEQDDPSNWINNQRDFQEADLALQTVTWDDGVPAPGAELLQALGICPGDNQNEDNTCSEHSDTDPSAFNRELVVAEEDANQVVAGHGDEHGDNESVDDDVNQFSPDDIDNFLENDSVLAAQTCSQEVRSRHVPQMGMDFETSKAAQAFYKSYSCLCGFAVRKASNYCGQTSTGGGESRCIFRCNRSGKVLDEEQKEAKRKQRKERWQERTGKLAPETRKRKRNVIDVTGCQAKLVVSKKNGRWFITDINLEHNHELSPPDESKFLRSHKQMTDEEKLLVRTLNSAKLPTRKIMDILSFLRHGPLPYTKKYVTNVRASIRKENDGNDMMQLLDYFRNKQAEDPRYYYKFKVHPQKPSKVLCIFWADGYSRKMYDLYGDSLSFDTTYKTNKYNLPFAPFVGVFGHGQNCLFACAIIQDETINTFIWLFQTFLECMGRKQPRTVITDQDTSMKEAVPEEAVPEVFNLSKHRNCLFHVKKKAEEKCCRTFVTKGDLHADFTDIVHNSLTVAEFEKLWQEMVQKYDIGAVNYFKIMWKERRRWAPVYFKTDFLPLLHSTSRSEGMNAIFKDNVASTDNVISFMTEYEKISERIQDMEREQDSLTRTTKPTFWVHNELEIQASRMYNRQIFYQF